MNKVAVYAGSFDPITNGHLWMIEQGSYLFDKVIVAIGTNSDKKCYFSLKERLDMLNKVVSIFNNVEVSEFTNKYLVKYASEMGANFILRGIRNATDFEYEKSMRLINSDMNPSITTVFLMPSREIAEVSSSIVRGLVGTDGWEQIVCRYIPNYVMRKFKEKLNGVV